MGTHLSPVEWTIQVEISLAYRQMEMATIRAWTSKIDSQLSAKSGHKRTGGFAAEATLATAGLVGSPR